jgi:hypothetical protein
MGGYPPQGVPKGVTKHTELTDKEVDGVIDHADGSVTDGKLASGVGLSDGQICKLPAAVEGKVLTRGAAAWEAVDAPITIFQPLSIISAEGGLDVLYLFLPANRTLKLWKVIASREGLAPAYPPPPANSILAIIETAVETLDSRDIWGTQPYTEAGGVLIEGSPLGSWSFSEDTLISFFIRNDHTVDVTIGAVVWVISIH